MSFFPSNNDKILIDDVGKYSISLPDKSKVICNLISKHVGSNDITITDAMACIGGDTLSFSQTFKNVIAVEMDKIRFEYLKHNMELFETTNIEFINNDYIKIKNMLKQDVIYIDPPWGGPDYKTKKTIKIKIGDETLESICHSIIDQKICKWLVLKLPFNYDLTELKFYDFKMYVLNKIIIILINII